jgi:hypothetical protein
MLLFVIGMTIGAFLSVLGCIVWACRMIDTFEQPPSTQPLHLGAAGSVSEHNLATP